MNQVFKSFPFPFSDHNILIFNNILVLSLSFLFYFQFIFLSHRRKKLGGEVRPTSQTNACTLVPTVFLRHEQRNSNFQFRFSFTHAIGKGKLYVYLPVSFSYYIENEIRTFIFVFRFPMTSYNRMFS